jgi:hypothetical protein
LRDPRREQVFFPTPEEMTLRCSSSTSMLLHVTGGNFLYSGAKIGTRLDNILAKNNLIYA